MGSSTRTMPLGGRTTSIGVGDTSLALGVLLLARSLACCLGRGFMIRAANVLPLSVFSICFIV